MFSKAFTFNQQLNLIKFVPSCFEQTEYAEQSLCIVQVNFNRVKCIITMSGQ